MKNKTLLNGCMAGLLLSGVVGMSQIMPAAASSTSGQRTTVDVLASSGLPGIPSGISATVGDQISITSNGLGQYGSEGAGNCGSYPWTDANGQRYVSNSASTRPTSLTPCGAKIDTGAPSSTLPVGRLLFRVGTSGSWDDVGTGYAGIADGTGQIYLLYNDSAAADNQGGYHVTVVDQPQVLVPASNPTPGLNSNIDVMAGENLSISAAGTATYGYDVRPCGSGYLQVNPDGAQTLNGASCGSKVDGGAVYPTMPIGTLLGQFDGAGWFPVGSTYATHVVTAATLSFLFNDAYNWSDNTGGYYLTVTATTPVPATSSTSTTTTGQSGSPGNSGSPLPPPPPSRNPAAPPRPGYATLSCDNVKTNMLSPKIGLAFLIVNENSVNPQTFGFACDVSNPTDTKSVQVPQGATLSLYLKISGTGLLNACNANFPTGVYQPGMGSGTYTGQTGSPISATCSASDPMGEFAQITFQMGAASPPPKQWPPFGTACSPRNDGVMDGVEDGYGNCVPIS